MSRAINAVVTNRIAKMKRVLFMVAKNPFQNKKYRCASGKLTAGSQVSN